MSAKLPRAQELRELSGGIQELTMHALTLLSLRSLVRIQVFSDTIEFCQGSRVS